MICRAGKGAPLPLSKESPKNGDTLSLFDEHIAVQFEVDFLILSSWQGHQGPGLRMRKDPAKRDASGSFRFEDDCFWFF
jgi:hypothetical protein